MSARANALALESGLAADSLLRALNGLSPDIFFTAAHAIDPSFSPRHASYRWYRYIEPAGVHDLARWKELIARFVGPVDARTFGRGVPASAAVSRTLTHASVGREGPWFVIDLKAPSFVWGMVRKIVASVRAVENGKVSESALDEAIAGRRRLTLPLAEPERLILWKVGYPFRFEAALPRYSVRQLRYWDGQLEAATVRSAVLERLRPLPKEA